MSKILLVFHAQSQRNRREGQDLKWAKHSDMNPGKRRLPHDLGQDLTDEEVLQSDSLAEALGIEIDYAPDDMAPPVDDGLIRAYVRQELDEDRAFEAVQMIASFRTWHTAWGRVVAEEARK